MNSKFKKPQPYQKLPGKLLERLTATVPDKVHKVYTAFTQKRVTTLRVNTLKTTREELKEKLHNAGIRLREVNWNRNAFIVLNELRELQETQLYKDGFFYVQSLSSQLPPLVLNPAKDAKVLDICAAPGSKTSQMAAIMDNTGEILANDTSHIRLLKLEANLKTLGVTNVVTARFSGQTLWEKFPEYFDFTLVDVPCTGEGRIYLNDPRTYEGWREKEVDRLGKQAQWILRSAISATKVGGRIVYSTCTLSAEENEEVIEWILEKEKGKVEIEDIKIPGLEFYPALKSWNGKLFDKTISKTVRILPSDTMEGFYVASLRKIKSNVSTGIQ